MTLHISTSDQSEMIRKSQTRETWQHVLSLDTLAYKISIQIRIGFLVQISVKRYGTKAVKRNQESWSASSAFQRRRTH
jgi:hypothetical protein